MTKNTKIFLALLIVVIGGGLGYYKWREGQEPVIEVRKIDKILNEVSFKMSYKGIGYTDTIKFGTIWTRTKKDYSFQVFFEHGDIYFLILDKTDSVIAEKRIAEVL